MPGPTRSASTAARTICQTASAVRPSAIASIAMAPRSPFSVRCSAPWVPSGRSRASTHASAATTPTMIWTDPVATWPSRAAASTHRAVRGCPRGLCPRMTSGDQPARLSHRGLLTVLVLAPDLDHDARATALRAPLLHHAVHAEPVAGEDRPDEGHGPGAALHETGPEQPRHHLGDVGGGHHSLREAGAEPLRARPRLGGMDGERAHAGVRVDLAL